MSQSGAQKERPVTQTCFRLFRITDVRCRGYNSICMRACGVVGKVFAFCFEIQTGVGSIPAVDSIFVAFL